MKTYKAYLDQGGGCDYTIACGFKLIDIIANSMEEAKQELAKIIVEQYSHDENKLDKAELFEVDQAFTMGMKAIYEKMRYDKNVENERINNDKEKAEFERLKFKFGG